MFERFTGKARGVMVHGQAEARSLKHNYFGTEHILLGLLQVEDGVAAGVLGSLGVTADRVRDGVVQIVGAGTEETTGQIPFTPRAKRALEFALREALALACNYIGTEHILLGLTRESEGVATRILVDLGVSAEQIRAELESALGAGTGALENPPKSRRVRRPRSAPAMFGAGPAMFGERSFWEYRVETHGSIDAAWLNELGADGWELAGIAAETLVFKRRCFPGSL